LTRQQTRAQERADAFRRVNAAYGLEPRKARRGIARAWATQAWRKRAVLATVSCGILALFSLGATPSAHAQGSRKDDVVFNAQGRPMAGATVRVCTSSATGQPCSPLAVIYSDAALTQALANPLSADGLGNYTFYAAPGRFEIEISGPGITTKQMPNVILPSDPSTPTFTTVTTTSGISAFSLSLTGNLTVSGSVAIGGTLTVGGVPVVGGGGGGGASTSTDNQWTAAQRFKGPIPWRDFTAYMPAGGCSATTGRSDPATTGSIASGSHTLTVASAIDFINGCGITVLHAGPTSSLVMPSCTFSSASGTGSVVTITCTGSTNLEGTGGPVQISSCSGGSGTFNGTFQVSYATVANQFQYAASGTGTPTGCVISFLIGWAHDVTGSTPDYYKVAVCDGNSGCSPAYGPVTITNANATLTYENFNWIGYHMPTAAKLACLYKSTDNVTYAAVATSMNGGFEDRGVALPVFASCPATPPATATAQQLTTTIASGAGTSTLTLVGAASNTATSQNVYHDETPFLQSCINDVASDQEHPAQNSFPSWMYGSHGCLIPAGNWNFNSDAVTDSATGTNAGGISIYVDGTIVLDTWPWILSGNSWNMQGTGNGGGAHVATVHFPTTYVQLGANVPIGFGAFGNNIRLHGFALQENGTTLGQVCLEYAGGGFDFGELQLGCATPMQVDSNNLYTTVHNVVMQPNYGVVPASVLFTVSAYNGGPWCCMSFDNIYTGWHGFYFEAPGGNQNGRGAPITVDNWELEEFGQYPPGAKVIVDAGNGYAPGADSAQLNVPGLSFRRLDNADSSDKSFLLYEGQNGAGSADFVLDAADTFNPIVSCDPASTVCSNSNPQLLPTSVASNSVESLNGLTGHYTGPGIDGREYTPPSVVLPDHPDFYQTPSIPSWADALPGPFMLNVIGTGGGGLAAGQYCIRVVGLDGQSMHGLTLPSPEACVTVGAASSISLQWQNPQSDWAYSDYHLYYNYSATLATPGGENYWIDTSIAPSATYPVTYTFTSTGGASSGTPPTYPTAYTSWLNHDGGQPSCLYCVPGDSIAWQLGIGEPSPPAGDKLAVKGGVLDAESGFKSALVTKSANYTLTTSDYGANVTGTTTITVPHASIGNHWVVFNSGTNAVTVQADSGNINGAANITISENTGKEIACDGTNCFAH
jgi:hypothetical protein